MSQLERILTFPQSISSGSSATVLNSNHRSTVCLIANIVSDCKSDRVVADVGAVKGSF